MFTNEELSILAEVLGEYMIDAYGEENAEGCFTSEQWEKMTALADKIESLRN